MKLVRTLLQILLPVVVIGLALAIAGALARSRPEATSAPPAASVPLVETREAVPRDVTVFVRTQGSVEPRTESRLVAEVGARVLSVAPALSGGGFFDQGDELVRLDDTDYRLALEEAKSRVAQAQMMLAQTESDAAVARRDWEALGRRDEPNPLVLREPQLAEARAALAAARAGVAKAERDVERSVVRAPYDGRARRKAVDVGEFVERGGELARIYAVDWAEVRLPVADDELTFLDLPLRARGPTEHPPVTLRARFAGAERSWEGEIVRTEGEIDPKSRMVTLVARVPDPYGRGSEAEGAPLVAGLFVEAVIQGRTLEDAIALPREAVHMGGRVFLLEEGRLEIRPVRVVWADREEVVVEGVAPGEEVVLTPLELPIEGMQLERQTAPGSAR